MAFHTEQARLDRLTIEQLGERRAAICAAAPPVPAGSLYLYDKATRRKLDAIDWAITYKLATGKEGTTP